MDTQRITAKWLLARGFTHRVTMRLETALGGEEGTAICDLPRVGILDDEEMLWLLCHALPEAVVDLAVRKYLNEVVERELPSGMDESLGPWFRGDLECVLGLRKVHGKYYSLGLYHEALIVQLLVRYMEGARFTIMYGAVRCLRLGDAYRSCFAAAIREMGYEVS